MNETTTNEKTRTNDPRRNPDPITKAPGAHPFGTGIGAAVGGAAGVAGAAAAGAVIGSPAGPAGAIVGAAVGAVVGGLAGKGVAEEVNPSTEDKYWRDNYANRPYFVKGNTYDQYGPAYKYGWEAYPRHVGRSFEDAEGDLSRDWDSVKGSSPLHWEHARHAVRDSWERLRTRQSGQSTRYPTN